uniref:T9SS type A sorting domain-containing protein n=1 Tax=Mariniflexile sp. TaxID=1979402 RepID=UPI004048BBCC
MKKITLFILTFMLFGVFTSNAQVFENENFDGLNIGNVGTDVTGATAGQGGLFTQANAASNSDFQIVDSGGSLGNVLQITGSNSITGSRFIWQNGLKTDWASRTLGNNFVEVEFNFFTGPATTSKNEADVEIYNSDYSIVIAGFSYLPETKVLTGLAYANGSSGLGTYLIFLGPSDTDLILPENVWVRLGVAFNVVTGEVIWKGTGFYIGFTGSGAGIAPFEVDFSLYAGTGNTVSSFMFVDDYRARAIATEDLLSINNDVKTISNIINIYPNPVEDVLRLSLSDNINLAKLEIVDINGRLIKTISAEKVFDKEVNTSDLNKGMYMLNIYSDKGKSTKKFIKK